MTASPSHPRRRHRAPAIAALTASAAVLLALGSSAALAADDDSDSSTGLPGSTLFVDHESTTWQAAATLDGQAKEDAELLGSYSSATWLSGGTPEEAEATADRVVTAAAERGEMPVLVAYDIPYRDCVQYSAGGAPDSADYQEWIDAIVDGIEGRPATVILEPDGLGIIPHYVAFDGQADWCQPAELDPTEAPADRFQQLNDAVDSFKASPNTSVYLDGTSSAWLGVADIANRLYQAGVERADGFFLNVSNYQYTENLRYFGNWITECLAYATEVDPGNWAACRNQYVGAPDGGALSQYVRWFDSSVSGETGDSTGDVSALNAYYADLLSGSGVTPSAHYVIDTSRNANGPWQYPVGIYGSQHEDWCNPPDRGAGVRPTTVDTGSPYADALLWVKTPGESDGKCYRNTDGPQDPERGMEDPDAGQWFVEQARELVTLADPELVMPTTDPTPTATPTETATATSTPTATPSPT
ncbi:MAG: glycoside hydrolase family 6 protein, partial [Microbacterium sp.]